MIDLATKKAVWQEVFEQAKAVRPLVLDSATRRVAMVVEGRLRVFDTARRRFVSDFGPSLPRLTSRSIAAPGNGILYAGSDRQVLAISLKTGRSEHVGELPAAVNHVAATRDGTVYVSCNTDVYRLRPLK